MSKKLKNWLRIGGSAFLLFIIVAYGNKYGANGDGNDSIVSSSADTIPCIDSLQQIIFQLKQDIWEIKAELLTEKNDVN
jgi:hypothetical protein